MFCSAGGGQRLSGLTLASRVSGPNRGTPLILQSLAPGSSSLSPVDPSDITPGGVIPSGLDYTELLLLAL